MPDLFSALVGLLLEVEGVPSLSASLSTCRGGVVGAIVGGRGGWKLEAGGVVSVLT